MLSCSCDYDYDWYYYPVDNFTKFELKRRKRCESCRKLINKGEDCLEFECFRDPNSDIEERIYGDEVPLACQYLCEKCGEIYLNLTDLGYCLSFDQPMEEYLKDYWEITGFKHN